MQAVALESAGSGMDESELLALGAPAYRLAARVLRSAEGADDAVQQAYLIAVRQIRAGSPPEELRTWFLKVVANAARKQLSSEASRRRREGDMVRQAMAQGAATSDELVAELRRAVDSLDEKYRLPIALCCEEGLTHQEAAAVLDVPRQTLSRHVTEGLEQLRKTLAKAGYAAAPAAVIGGLARTAPPVPATLAAALEKLVAGQMAVKGTGAVAVSSAAKGGLTVKIVAGVVLAGALAGGLSAFGFRHSVPPPTAYPAPPNGSAAASSLPPTVLTAPPAAVPAAEEKGEPVYDCQQMMRVGFWQWHSQFLWTGPAKSANVNRLHALAVDDEGIVYGASTGLVGRGGSEGRLTHECVIMKWDLKTDFVTRLAGGARGAALDGPGETAQFNYQWYSCGGMAIDRKRGYLYLSDNVNNGAIRRISTKDGYVTTVAPELVATSVAVDQEGLVYIHVPYRGKTGLYRLTPQGQPGAETYKTEYVGQGGPGPGFLVVDANRSKAYVAGRGWLIDTVQVWDLKAFNGQPVKPAPIATPARKFTGILSDVGKSDGPLEGAFFYCPIGLFRSPDGKYLYLGGGDQDTYRRIDVDARRISSFHLLPDGRYTWKEHKEKGEKGLGWPWPQCLTETEDGTLYSGESSPGIMRLKIVGRQ